MPDRSAFEYAVIRVVPRVERGECINVGVVLFCRTRRFLQARIQLDHARLAAFAPTLDVGLVEMSLDHMVQVCKGGRATGPIGELPQPERFRWVTAPRSTIIQPSPVHCGMCDDPQHTLDTLFTSLVLVE